MRVILHRKIIFPYLCSSAQTSPECASLKFHKWDGFTFNPLGLISRSCKHHRKWKISTRRTYNQNGSSSARWLWLVARLRIAISEVYEVAVQRHSINEAGIIFDDRGLWASFSLKMPRCQETCSTAGRVPTLITLSQKTVLGPFSPARRPLYVLYVSIRGCITRS